MEIYDDAQQRVENAMTTVLGLDDEQQTYADTEVGDGVFVMIQTDDDTIYIDIGFDEPPKNMPRSPELLDESLDSLTESIERAYLRVQQRRTSFDFSLTDGKRPTYRATRPLVVED